MEIRTRREEDVAIVEIEGRMVAGLKEDELRRTLDDLLAAGTRKFVLNLSQVLYIDSSGIGELVAAQKVGEHFGAKIKLVELGERVEHVLKLGMLLPLFETYSTEREAVESFRSR